MVLPTSPNPSHVLSFAHPRTNFSHHPTYDTLLLGQWWKASLQRQELVGMEMEQKDVAGGVKEVA